MEYWRYHKQISASEVRQLFRWENGPKDLTDTYAQAVWLSETAEAMSIRYGLDNRCKNDCYCWGTTDYDGYEIDNLVGLS